MTGSELMLIGLHPRSAIPEPDQGPPDLARSRAASSKRRCATISTISSADNMERGKALLGYVLERMDERLRRKQEREVKRKTATSARKLRLPGKLTDCSADDPEGTEIFIVEGDSAPAARPSRRATARRRRSCRSAARSSTSPRATTAKIFANQEIADLIQALGCGTRKDCDARQSALRTHRHHDRRRCRRRAYRDAADDLLLPGNARSRAARAPLSRAAAALSPDRRAPRASMRATTRTAPRSRPDRSRARRSRSRASRVWAR